MKKLNSLIAVCLLFAIVSRAQNTDYAKGNFYGGAQGGYLFKNKANNDNKAWHLKDGRFAELNVGYKKNSWGVSAALGYLLLQRDPKKFETHYVNRRQMFDSITGGIVPPLVAGFDVVPQDLNFGPTQHAQMKYEDLDSYYFLLGPEYWLGKGRWKAQLQAQAGVGYTQFGYYVVNGKTDMTKETELYQDAGGANYDVTASADYVNFAGTTKTFNAAMGNVTGAITDKRALHFMARATASVNYFVTPTIAVHAGASYWYIPSPDMTAYSSDMGSYVYNTVPVSAVAYQGRYSFTNHFEANNISNFSANAGIKIFLHKNAKTPKPVPVVATAEVAAAPASVVTKAVAKDVIIVVKDKQTGLALSGVQVQVLKDGVYYSTGMTDQNGQLEKITDVSPGNYTIKGSKNNIVTNDIAIAQTEFEQEAKSIFKELLHDDPRFTLIGNTVNKKDKSNLSGINTSLTNVYNAGVTHQTSDAGGKFIYQLEQGTDYTVVANEKGYFSNSETVTTKGLDRSKTLYTTLLLGIDELSAGNQFELKNILYPLNKADITADAALILDRLVATMHDNPELEIELSSHTDSRGSAVYNQSLSQKRAQSAINYLVRKGIAKKRLVAKGYGESKLLNSCADGTNCSEEEHAINRRTEIKVLKNN